MSELDDLLAACVANPDDDAPRLVWADAVGGERGELVVIQCRLERDDLPLREAVALRRRQRDLLARHGIAWSGLGGHAHRIAYRRGFVDAAAVHAGPFLAQAPAIRAAAPLLETLQITDPEGDALGAAVARAGWVRGLDLVTDGRVDLEGWRLPAGLRALGLTGELDQRSAEALAAVAAGLERLSLAGEVAPDTLLRILEHAMPALRAIGIVTSAGALGRIAPRVPRAVTELRFGELQDGELGALANAPVARTLERFTVASGSLVHDLRLLDRFPRLRALSFHGLVDFGNAAVRAAALRTLMSLRLPALRELAITALLDEQSTLRVAETFGAQLELLDLRNNHHALRHVHELRLRVAGEVLVEHPFRQVPEQGLLRLGVARQLPWWDHLAP